MKYNSFNEKLRSAIQFSGNPLCLGVDPHFVDLPPFMSPSAIGDGHPLKLLQDYSFTIVEAASQLLPAVKIQSAFFEAFGGDGFEFIKKLVAHCKSNGLLTVLDAKRGDISSTMRAYGEMAFDYFGADAMTITPYMGVDVVHALTPWMKKGRGVYAVWISSNPSGCSVQQWPASKCEKSLAHHLLDEFALETSWADSLGLVLGANQLQSLSPELVDRMTERFLLLPGVGPQGGSIDSELKGILSNGNNLLPMSRGLSGIADKGSDPDLDGMTTWDSYGEWVQVRIKDVLSSLI
jgi:orotidine-5'-phosphate decarboxylase